MFCECKCFSIHFPTRIPAIHDETESFTFHRTCMCLILWLWHWIASDIFVILLIPFQPPAVTRLPSAIPGTKNKSASKGRSPPTSVDTLLRGEKLSFLKHKTSRNLLSLLKVALLYACGVVRKTAGLFRRAWNHRRCENTRRERSAICHLIAQSRFENGPGHISPPAHISLIEQLKYVLACRECMYVCVCVHMHLSACFQIEYYHAALSYCEILNVSMHCSTINTLVSRSCTVPLAVIFLSVCVGVCVHTAVCV